MQTKRWPVDWSAVWVGALGALAATLIFGLIGTAIGAQAPKTFSSWHTVSVLDLIVVVLTAFFGSVVGGWIAGKIAGFEYAEPSILHAAIAWLVAVPLLLGLLAAGAGSAFGGWYGGLVGTSPLVASATAAATPEDVVRNGALASLTGILISLMGAVIGGWMASGEPMTFTHHRTRQPVRTGERRIP